MLTGLLTLLLSLACTWIGMALVKLIEFACRPNVDAKRLPEAFKAILTMPMTDWPIFLVTTILTMILFVSLSASRAGLNDAIILLNAMSKNQSVRDRFVIGACRRFRSQLLRLPLYASLLAGLSAQMGARFNWSIRDLHGRWIGFAVSLVVTYFLSIRMHFNLIAMQIAIDQILPPDEVKRFLKSRGI